MSIASMEVPAVYLLQDQADVREAVGRELIAAGYRVFPSASPREFFANYVYDAPGCLVLDFGMPGCNEKVRAELADRGLTPQIVYVSEGVDVAQALEVAKCETADLILKPVRVETITAAIADALARDAKARATQLARSRLEELTAIEREVLSHVLKGDGNKATAEALGMGAKTIKNHRQRLMRKLKVGSVAKLIQFAMVAGVYSVPVPPRSGPYGKGAQGRQGAVIRKASSSVRRRSAASADVEKRLMAAAIHELHALFSREAGSQELAKARAAAQLARALAPSARSILAGERIDVGVALKAIDGLGLVLGEDHLQNFRHSVLRPELEVWPPGDEAHSRISANDVTDRDSSSDGS